MYIWLGRVRVLHTWSGWGICLRVKSANKTPCTTTKWRSQRYLFIRTGNVFSEIVPCQKIAPRELFGRLFSCPTKISAIFTPRMLIYGQLGKKSIITISKHFVRKEFVLSLNFQTYSVLTVTSWKHINPLRTKTATKSNFPEIVNVDVHTRANMNVSIKNWKKIFLADTKVHKHVQIS